MFETPRRKLLGMTRAVFGFFTTLSIFALAKSRVGYHGIAGQINRRPAVGLRPCNGRHAHRVSSGCRSVDAELTRRTEDRNPDHVLNLQIGSDSLQNPSDPDATYSGHKGQGYQVQNVS
jgi:hypothetical protein